MGEGKDRYEERRRLENENALLREQKENRRRKHEAELEEGAIAIINGLRSLFDGKGCLIVEPLHEGRLMVTFSSR